MNKRAMTCFCLMIFLAAQRSLSQSPAKSCAVPLVVSRFVPSNGLVELVKDLSVQDFKIRVGTSLVPVQNASIDSGPKRVALILDASQSIPDAEWKLETEMASVLVQNGRPEDRFFVSFVGNDKSPSTPLSPREATELLQKLAEARPVGEHSERVYDALSDAVDRMIPAEFGDALFLFGHPDDLGSKIGADGVTTKILKNRLRFYGVSFTDPLNGKLPAGFDANKPLPANLGPPRLAQMSASTGYFFSFHSVDSLNFPGQMRLLEGFLGDLYSGIAQPYRLTFPQSDVKDRTKLEVVLTNMADREINSRDIHFPRYIYPCSVNVLSQ